MKNENLVLSKRVDKGPITTVEDLESWFLRAFTLRQSERLIRSNEGPFALTKVHSR